MPIHCIASGCDIKSGMGNYTLLNEGLQTNHGSVCALKQERNKCNGPQLIHTCFKHLEDHYFVTKSICYCESIGVVIMNVQSCAECCSSHKHRAYGNGQSLDIFWPIASVWPNKYTMHYQWSSH